MYAFTEPQRVDFAGWAWKGVRSNSVEVRLLSPDRLLHVAGSLLNLFKFIKELVIRRETEENRGLVAEVLSDAEQDALTTEEEERPAEVEVSLWVSRVLANRCQQCMDKLKKIRQDANVTYKMLNAIQSSLVYNRAAARIPLDAEAEFIWHMCACHVKSAAAGTAQMDEDGLRRVIVSTYRLITQWISCRKFSSLSTLQGACASTAPRTSMSTGDPYRECSAP